MICALLYCKFPYPQVFGLIRICIYEVIENTANTAKCALTENTLAKYTHNYDLSLTLEKKNNSVPISNKRTFHCFLMNKALEE